VNIIDWEERAEREEHFSDNEDLRASAEVTLEAERGLQ